MCTILFFDLKNLISPTGLTIYSTLMLLYDNGIRSYSKGQICTQIIVRRSELIERGNVNTICNNLFNLYRQYYNTWFICDGSNRAATNLLKIKFNEPLEWDPDEVSPDSMRVIPINFGTQHKNLLSHTQTMISKGYLAVPEKGNEQLLTALRTAYARELSLDKNVSVYDDLTDALRLALRAYNII